MADSSDPRCRERRLRAGPVAGDAHPSNMAGASQP
jgi:hypothetical protein